MNEISHIISPASAGWTGWVMLCLLVCAVLAEYLQRGIITQAAQSIFAQGERMYKDAPIHFGAQVLISLFRIGTIAMALCFCCYHGQPMRFAMFGIVCGVIIGVLGVKMACHGLLDYTFMLRRRYAFAYEHYANVSTLAVIVLYPLLLILMHVDNPIACKWSVGLVAVLFILLWLYRGGRLFIQSPMAILYFAIYIGTLELLPMAALYYLSEITIQML